MRTSNRKNISSGDISSGNTCTKKPSARRGNIHSTRHTLSSSSCRKSKRAGAAAKRIRGSISWRASVVGVSPFLLSLFLCCMPPQQCSAAVTSTAIGGHSCKAAAFSHLTEHPLALLTSAAAAEVPSEGAATAAAVTVGALARLEDKGTVAATVAHCSTVTATFKQTTAAAALGSTGAAPNAAAAHAPVTAAAPASTGAAAASEVALTPVVLYDTRASAASTAAAAAHQRAAGRTPPAPTGDRKEGEAPVIARTTFSVASEALGAFLEAAAAWAAVAAAAKWPAAAAAVFAAGKRGAGGAARRLAAAYSVAEAAWFLQGASAAARRAAAAAAASTSSSGQVYHRYSLSQSPFLSFLQSSSSHSQALPGRRCSAAASLAAAGGGGGGSAPAANAASRGFTRHAGAAAAAAPPVKGDDGSPVLPPNPRAVSPLSHPACGVSPSSASPSSAGFPWCNNTFAPSAAASPSLAATGLRAAAPAAAAPPRGAAALDATPSKAAALPGTSFLRLVTPLLWQRLRRQAATQQWTSSARREASEVRLHSLLATPTTPPPVGEDSSSRGAIAGGDHSRSRSARRGETTAEEGSREAGVTEQPSTAISGTVEAKAEAAALPEEPPPGELLLTPSSRRRQRRPQEAEAQQQVLQGPQEQREEEQQQRQEQQQQQKDEEGEKEEISGVPLTGIMAWRCTGRSNDDLVDRLRDAGVITNPKVYEAMKAVDRGNFIDTCAYMDSPQPLGIGSATISAPHMHAAALEELADVLQPGKRVLDVGSGSGYLTVVMAYIVGVKGIRDEKAATSPQQEAEPEGVAVGIDYVPGLVKYSQDRVRKAYPRLLSNPHFQLVERDGWEGYPAAAPYDAIHVGAAATAIPRRLLQQLKNGGKMVLPVEESLQGEILFEEDDEEGKKRGREEKGVMSSLGRGSSAAEGNAGGRGPRDGGGGDEESSGERRSSTASSIWSRLLMGSGGQRFVAVTKDANGNVHVKKLMGVMYVPLVKRKNSVSAKNA